VASEADADEHGAAAPITQGPPHKAPTLEHLLSPLTITDFQAQHHGKKPLVVRGDGSKFEALFSWGCLSRLLNFGAKPLPSLKMNVQGRFLELETQKDVLAGLRQGATLIFENVERFDLALATFLDRLATETSTPNRFNLYASPVGRQGYNIHYDTHDVFVLQIEGCKDWFVFPATIDQPLYFQKHHSVSPPDLTKPELQCTLNKGDVLYIPKGHWHYALAADEPSLHLTLGLFTKTGIDLLNWLVDEFRDDVLVRGELPLVVRDSLGWPNTPSAFSDQVNGIREKLNARLSDRLLAQKFHQYNIANAKSRRLFNLPSQIGDIDPNKAPEQYARHPYPFVLDVPSESAATLYVRDKEYNIHKDLLPLVRVVFGTETISKSAMLASNTNLSWTDIWPFVSDLMKEGILYPAYDVIT
jgi:ribosomal protein L16 Arg81 hydroxylase